MQRLLQFQEAAERYYGGDQETLRQSVGLGLIRAKVELVGTGQWAWWVDYDWIDCDDDASAPESGKTETCEWRRVRHGAYELAGWFYLSRRVAAKIAHGVSPDMLLASVEEE